MRSGLHTPLCDLLDVRYPILNAGIGWAAGPELAAAVSNAGGFGVLGGGSSPIELVAARIAKTRSLTSAPFGVNVIIAETDPGDDVLLRDLIAAISELDVAAIVLFWGVRPPKPRRPSPPESTP